MRVFISILALCLAVQSPALAQSIVIPRDALPYDSLTASCDTILAHTNDSKWTKLSSANLYENGMHMGNRCIKVDLVSAYELYIAAGYPDYAKGMVERARGRAAGGNPLAVSAFKKLKTKGYAK